MVPNSGAAASVQQEKTLEQLFDEAPRGVEVDCVFPGFFGGGRRKVAVRELANGVVAFKAPNGAIKVPKEGTALQYQIIYALEAGKQGKRADAAMSNLNNAEKGLTNLKGQLKETQQESSDLRGKFSYAYESLKKRLEPVVHALGSLARSSEIESIKAVKIDSEYSDAALELIGKYVPIAVKGATDGVAEAGKLNGQLATAQSKATTLQQVLDSFGGVAGISKLKQFEAEREQIKSSLEAAEKKAKEYEGLPPPDDIKGILEEAAKRGTAPQQKYVIIDVGEEKVSVPARYVDLVRQQLALAARAVEFEDAGYASLQDVETKLAKSVKELDTRAAGLERALSAYRAIDASLVALQEKVTRYDKLQKELDGTSAALEAYKQIGLNAGEVGGIADANKGLVTRVKELEQKLAAAAAAPQSAPAQLQAPAPQDSATAQTEQTKGEGAPAAPQGAPAIRHETDKDVFIYQMPGGGQELTFVLQDGAWAPESPSETLDGVDSEALSSYAITAYQRLWQSYKALGTPESIGKKLESISELEKKLRDGENNLEAVFRVGDELREKIRTLEAQLAAAPQSAAQPQAPAPQQQQPLAPQAPAATYEYHGGFFPYTTVNYCGKTNVGRPIGSQFIDVRTCQPAALPEEVAAEAIAYHKAKGKPGK